jgi:hypothetical protein
LKVSRAATGSYAAQVAVAESPWDLFCRPAESFQGEILASAPWSPAMSLLALFTEKMTSGDGRVYYGRAVTYRQVASWFRSMHGRAPSQRTLHRWMRTLKQSGNVVVKKTPLNQGMRIFVLSPTKHFRAMDGAPRQLSLYSEPVQMPVQKPVEKVRNSQVDARPKVASPRGQKWPDKRSTSNKENLTTGALAPPRFVRSSAVEEFYRLRKVLAEMPSGHPRHAQLCAQLRTLGEQIDGEIAQESRRSRREAG